MQKAVTVTGTDLPEASATLKGSRHGERRLLSLKGAPPGERAPLYAQLASEFRRQIDGGVLRPGDKLPSIRALRRGRRVSAATVMEAYLRLERDGYVRARDRSGFYVLQSPAHAVAEPQALRTAIRPAPVGISKLVADVLSQTGDPKLVPLGVSVLGSAFLPIARLNRAFRRVLTRSPLHSARYTAVRGHQSLRRQIARRSIASGTLCDPDDVIVTSGGMDSLNLALRAVTPPGGVVAVESPTYFGVLQALESVGLRAIEVPTDPRSGLDLNLLEQVIRKHDVTAVVSMTTCHNPLGTVMSDAAKADLVGLTARYDVALIEDGVYSELVYDETRRRPAKAFDRKGLVVFCGSFSKVLAPGLRVGWVEAGRFRDRVEALKGITSLMTAALPQLAIADLLESGFFDRYIKRLRLTAAGQVSRYLQSLVEALPSGTRMTRPGGGNLVWLQLPDKLNGTAVYRRMLEQGVGIFPGEIFSAGGKHRHCIRISCGMPWSPATERALGLLGRTCHDLLK
jgi:DNA-binding transcriptional MocR family regulator